MKQENSPKHTKQNITEWLKKKRIKVLQWSSQSPALYLIAMLCWDLKVYKEMFATLRKQQHKEERSKISPQ